MSFFDVAEIYCIFKESKAEFCRCKEIRIFAPSPIERKLLRLSLLSSQAINIISQQYLTCFVFYLDKFLIVEACTMLIAHWVAYTTPDKLQISP